MKLCNMLNNRKTEAGSSQCPTSFLVDTIKTLKDPLLISHRDSASVIRYRNQSKIILPGKHSSIETTNIYVQANTDMIDKALSRYSFFEQPFAKYQATDAVLAKLDAIKKKCRSKSHINFVGR